MSETDWEARLRAQGVSDERIAMAKRAARQMVEALGSVSFTPADPIAPEQYQEILAACARERDEA